MRRRDWLSWWFAEGNQRRDKVTASEINGFASKTGISLGFYWARVTGLNAIDSPEQETVKKPRPVITNIPALVKFMQRRQVMKKVFSTRHAYAVSFWSFLMMMTGQSEENAASSGQNSSLMPTTLFDSSGFLLASARFSADLMQHQDLRIRFYRWYHFHYGLFWYSIKIFGALLSLASFLFSFFWYSISRSDKTGADFLFACTGRGQYASR